MTMVRKQLYLTPEQNAKLKQVAKASGQTEAEVIRAALAAFVERVDPALDVLQNEGLLAKPLQPQLSPQEAQQRYAEYLSWASQQAPVGLADAVLDERREGR
jgi:antitoxin ParD1/3/4